MSCPSGNCRPRGPNVRKLIVHKMSLMAVPPAGGIGDVIGFLGNGDRMIRVANEATDWVTAAIATVKTAPDNPYGDDDEAIAGEILRQVEARKG